MPESIRTYVDALDLKVFALIPLKTGGEVLGLLAMGFTDPDRKFSSDEVALAETIASDVASAIKNAQLSEQARLAAIEAERQRLARELHDSVTQSLYSLTLLSDGWRTMAEQGTLANPAASFERLGDVGQQALKEMRLMIHQLRPSILEEVGLERGLQVRLEAVEMRANIEAHLKTSGDLETIPVEVEEQMFYIAQEALNNSLRHAQASEVNVQIQVAEDQLTLSIQDNGKGFDPNMDTAGMGLINMRQRATSIGGDLTILSEPGFGSTVTAHPSVEI
jgi:signal transduction histidine kinase